MTPTERDGLEVALLMEVYHHMLSTLKGLSPHLTEAPEVVCKRASELFVYQVILKLPSSPPSPPQADISFPCTEGA